jgi:G6PDH family F420-dependent oxidoreductase
VLGAVAAVTRRMRWETAVTCPTVRMHPAIVAQAAATTATLMPGRFRLGVGSGEALNETVLGDRWPRAATRMAMLEEAVEVMRRLWSGETVSHEGRHYVVEHARIYSLPDEAPPVLVSGFHDGSIELAARIGDGFVTTKPDADAIATYRKAGGRGPTQTSLKCCYGPDREACVETAHRLWPNAALPGELSQVLPTPAHFEQAAQLVSKEAIGSTFPCGPDPEEHVAAVQEFVDAGYDEVYVAHIGPGHDAFLDFYAREVVPRVRGAALAA